MPTEGRHERSTAGRLRRLSSFAVSLRSPRNDNSRLYAIRLQDPSYLSSGPTYSRPAVAIHLKKMQFKYSTKHLKEEFVHGIIMIVIGLSAIFLNSMGVIFQYGFVFIGVIKLFKNYN